MITKWGSLVLTECTKEEWVEEISDDQVTSKEKFVKESRFVAYIVEILE